MKKTSEKDRKHVRVFRENERDERDSREAARRGGDKMM